VLSPHIAAYDYVIVDSGPGWDALAFNVLFFAEELIAPVRVEAMAIGGLLSFIKLIQRVQETHDVALRHVLPTAVDRRVKQTDEILPQLQAHFGELLCSPIRYNIRLSEAFGHGEHIYEYAPDSNGAADYLALTKRIVSYEQKKKDIHIG
jgi:chromosome partitioning protein